MGNTSQSILPAAFLPVAWTLTAVTTVLFLGRLLFRTTILKRFHLDDAFSTAAWLSMIIAIILATVATPLNYEYGSILVGETPTPSPAELARIAIALRKFNVPAEFLFWTGLYCVKLSFMSLYRLVFGSRGQYRHTWALTTTYIILSYGVCLVWVFGQCGSINNLFSYEQCKTLYIAHLSWIWAQYFFNLTSSFLVIVFPLPTIWHLNISVKQRLAVTSICGLALLTVAVDVLRTRKLFENNFALADIYGYLELVIAVLASVLPSYESLVFSSEKNREDSRRFWSWATFRSRSSNPRGHSMEIADNRGNDQPERVVNNGATVLEPAPPMAVFQHV
ncbi:hypothetical protein F4801DRAFT_600156 [Xylaria longipes]|nr:hypothetical protein F4801DRAFT_600156 [Xylaria longipes]